MTVDVNISLENNPNVYTLMIGKPIHLMCSKWDSSLSTLQRSWLTVWFALLNSVVVYQIVLNISLLYLSGCVSLLFHRTGACTVKTGARVWPVRVCRWFVRWTCRLVKSLSCMGSRRTSHLDRWGQKEAFRSRVWHNLLVHMTQLQNAPTSAPDH